MRKSNSSNLRRIIAARIIAAMNVSRRLADSSFLAALTEGKMLRGLLTLKLGHALGTTKRRLVDCAAAVELAHYASLLHDDVVDGDRVRRHRPALWTAKGLKHAVLWGDMLVACATKLIVRYAPEMVPDTIETFSEMCEGELEEQAGEGRFLTGHIRIAERKTGSLFGFAAACAAGEDSQTKHALFLAGRLLGTAYQIADDIRDKSLSSTIRRRLTAGESRSVSRLIEQAVILLQPRPALKTALEEYIETDFAPALAAKD